MYRLTEKRLRSAMAVFEECRQRLFAEHSFDALILERHLKTAWGIGYQELKDVMQDMLRNARFREVAVFYMEHSNTPGVVSEFKEPLARVYGISHYDAKDREARRKAYWEEVFRDEAQ